MQKRSNEPGNTVRKKFGKELRMIVYMQEKYQATRQESMDEK